MDGKLRTENGENVVDVTIDLYKDVAEPIFVRKHYKQNDLSQFYNTGNVYFRSKVRYSFVPKVIPSIRAF